jgi:hypothetical protein
MDRRISDAGRSALLLLVTYDDARGHAGIDGIQHALLEHLGSLPATSEEAPKASS